MEFLLPVKFSEAGVSVGLTAVLFSLVSLCSGLLDIPSGKLSDRIGRERLIAYSMVLAALAAVALYFSNNVFVFFAAAVLFGASYGLNWSPLLALIGDDAEKDGHGTAFGRFFRIVAIGEGLAPIGVAFLIAYLSLDAPFLAVAGVAILCLFLIYGAARKPATRAEEHARPFSYRDTLRLFRRSLPLNLFLVATAFFVAFFWESVWFTQPLVGFYENSFMDSALIIAAFSVPSILFSDVLGKFIDRFGERRVFTLSSLLSVASFLAFYLSTALPMKVISIFVAAIGVLGIWLVMDVLTSRLHAPQERGEFFGILETVRDIAYFASPLFIALTYRFIGLEGVFAVNAVAALALLCVSFFALRTLPVKAL